MVSSRYVFFSKKNIYPSSYYENNLHLYGIKYSYQTRIQPGWLGICITPTASLQRGRISAASILDVALSSPKDKLQPQRLGKCGVSLHCYCS